MRVAHHRRGGHANVQKEPCQRPLDAISRVAARLLRDAHTLRPRTRPAKGLVHELGPHVSELSTIHPHKTAQPCKGSETKDHLLPVGRQLNVQAKVSADAIGKRPGRVGVPMDDEDRLRTAV